MARTKSQSGKLARTKGRAFEQEIARRYRALWPKATVRRALQAHKAYEPDVVVEGLNLWTECQDASDPNPVAKLTQAVRDMGRAQERGFIPEGMRVYPVVVWHKKGERAEWATFRLADLMALAGGTTFKPVPDSPLNEVGIAVTLRLEDALSVLNNGLGHGFWTGLFGHAPKVVAPEPTSSEPSRS